MNPLVIEKIANYRVSAGMGLNGVNRLVNMKVILCDRDRIGQKGVYWRQRVEKRE